MNNVISAEAPSALSAGIESLDLEPVKYNLVAKSGWDLARADAVETLYKRFLLLSVEHPDKVVVPTEDIDEMWHAHILDTRKYHDDCMRVFGRFIHHFPYLGMLDDESYEFLQDNFVETESLFMREAGVDLQADYEAPLSA